MTDNHHGDDHSRAVPPRDVSHENSGAPAGSDGGYGPTADWAHQYTPPTDYSSSPSPSSQSPTSQSPSSQSPSTAPFSPVGGDPWSSPTTQAGYSGYQQQYSSFPGQPTQPGYQQYSQYGGYTQPTQISSVEPARTRDSSVRASTVVIAAVVALIAGGVAGFAGSRINDSSSTGGSSAPLVVGKHDASQPSDGAPGSVQEVAAKVLPSVVSIDIRVGNEEGEGSGVVLSDDGYILTNNHVVTGETSRVGELAVSYNDGSTSSAKIVGADPISDIAVIKADKSGLSPITVGASSNLAVGQTVIAIGSPLGLAGTVTTGIISSLNRPVSTRGQDSGQTSVIDAIQTDAAINPGNSGGALVNSNGALIGVNTAIANVSSGSEKAGSIGLGFAIPVDQAVRIAKELQSTGKATQAGLGVGVASDRAARTPGATISSVQKGGAADKAGIPNGAVITRVDNRIIASGGALVAAVRSHAPGDTVTITYSVKGASKTAKVTLDTLTTGGR